MLSFLWPPFWRATEFAEPLTASERRALERVDREAERLLADRGALQNVRCCSALFSVPSTSCWCRTRISAAGKRPAMPLVRHYCPSALPAVMRVATAGSCGADAIDPELVVSCFWGGLNPGGRDETYCLSGRRVFCQPEPVSLARQSRAAVVSPPGSRWTCWIFAALANLPVYPVGLITDYAVNADGLFAYPSSVHGA